MAQGGGSPLAGGAAARCVTARFAGRQRGAAWGEPSPPRLSLRETGKGDLAARFGQDGLRQRTGAGLRGDPAGAAHRDAPDSPVRGPGGDSHGERERATKLTARERGTPRTSGEPGSVARRRPPYPEPAIKARATASACRRRRAGSPLWGFLWLGGAKEGGVQRGETAAGGGAVE